MKCSLSFLIMELDNALCIYCLRLISPSDYLISICPLSFLYCPSVLPRPCAVLVLPPLIYVFIITGSCCKRSKTFSDWVPHASQRGVEEEEGGVH